MGEPSVSPSVSPSDLPSDAPSAVPSAEPSVLPSGEPSSSPTFPITPEPSSAPSDSVLPSSSPTSSPTKFGTTAAPTPLSAETCAANNPVVCGSKNGVDKIAVCIYKVSKKGDYNTKCLDQSKGLNKKETLLECGCCVNYPAYNDPNYC